MNEAQKKDGGFYADHDEKTAMWCVFGTESGFAYSSWADEKSAEEAAKRMKNEDKESSRVS